MFSRKNQTSLCGWALRGALWSQPELLSLGLPHWPAWQPGAHCWAVEQMGHCESRSIAKQGCCSTGKLILPPGSKKGLKLVAANALNSGSFSLIFQGSSPAKFMLTTACEPAAQWTESGTILETSDHLEDTVAREGKN